MKTEKRIDENLYNEKSLYLLNIKELRDLGRKIGVPAPATLKKQDLVDYILKIVYGEIDAPKRSSYGRPNVREVDMNQYLTKIMKKTFNNLSSFTKEAISNLGYQFEDELVITRVINTNGKNSIKSYQFNN